ncbi:MAG: hypothetical protein HC771_03710 [Synechococcales cyanobacterium CRU_2_2]|nr:hypothetical protein [Synechococcales cyanobacterium CRU_2_2]
MAAQQYEKAVKRLEHYLQLKKQFDPAKPQTHVALARAYQGNRQRREAIQLCQHLIKVGDKGTRLWAQQFMEASQRHPRAHDPLAVMRGDEAKKPEIRWDVTTKATIVGLHGSIYLGLLLSPLVPGSLWRDLGLALMREGAVSLALLQPLAIALVPLSVPLVLFVTGDDGEIRSHAQEVLNYWITTLAIALFLSVFGSGLDAVSAALAKLPLALNLVRLLVWMAGLSYGLGPLLAVGWYFWKPERLFRYPFILRLV